MKFAVKYFPEIIMKSRSVRKRFSKQLETNLRNILKKTEVRADIQSHWDNLTISMLADDDKSRRTMIEILSHTPGIAFSFEIVEHQFETMDDIFQIVKETNGPSLAGKTFCVRAKRNGEHDFTSHDIERYVGGGLLKETDALAVKLRNPDILVNIEVKHSRLYAIKQRIQGLGGYPIGSQGDIVSLISGGFDSTVASYMMMKRGLKTHYLFFNLGGSAHEIGVKQVSHFLWQKYGESHKVKFITVPFEGVVQEILENVSDGHMGVVLKRMMYRAADQICERYGIEAFTTGESISQVSSQTLTNLALIDKATDKLVIRPLVTMDKPEIISISRQIGTEAFAATMPEYCGVISVKPTTEAKMPRVLEEEAHFNMEVLDLAIYNARREDINKMMLSEENALQVPQVNVPQVSDIIIDIRHPNEVAIAPLELTNNEVICIPFYELESRAASFDKDIDHLLYCQKGTMSQVHAHHLIGQGHSNIKVFSE